jgi:hypothetical protein
LIVQLTGGSLQVSEFKQRENREFATRKRHRLQLASRLQASRDPPQARRIHEFVTGPFAWVHESQPIWKLWSHFILV